MKIQKFEGELPNKTKEMVKWIKNSKVSTLEDLLNYFPELKQTKLLNVYLFGSRLFGTATEKSDFDFLIICDDYNGDFVLNRNEEPSIDLSIMSSKTFKQKVLNLSYHELITIWFPKEYIFLELLPGIEILNHEIDTSKLRSTLSLQAKQVWERSKEKFEMKDYQRGKKGITHALRIFELGSQIAKDGIISDFSLANEFHFLMFEKYQKEENWKTVNEVFRPMYIEKHEIFKKNAPKK
jgi:predicted nucleotidyltransferase